jgi:hypothetical protein
MNKALNNQPEIEPLYLLNSPIEVLKEQKLINIRVYHSLQRIKVNNFAELKTLVKRSLLPCNGFLRTYLDELGKKTRIEITELFHKANIDFPKYW